MKARTMTAAQRKEGRGGERAARRIRAGCAFLILCIALIALLTLFDLLVNETDAPPPNVLIILADDLGWGDAGCYGATKVETPNIDRLASNGVRFTAAYATASICSPSRYSLLTGCYPTRAGMDCGTLVPDSPLSISEDTGTLASALQGCGYTTAAIGKWHLGIGLPPRTDWSKPLAPGPLSVGFDSFFGIPSNPASPPGCYVRNDSLVPGECKPEEITPRCTDEAVEFIGRQAGRIQPFFLCFTPTAVHDPVAPSERFRGQSGIGEYGDFVSELDWSVGRLLDELEEQKLTTDTLVLFLSDNGADIDVSAWAPPGQLDESKKARTQSWSSGHLSNGPFRSGKQSIYDGGVRVPFIASWPGRIPRSTSTDGIISFTDIYASVLALAGVEADYIPPESVDRSDLFLRPGDGKHPARAPILVKSHPNIYALRSQRWKYIRHTDFLSPAVPGWWVSMFGQENEDQLYDMEADPGETVNVLDENPKVVEEMGQALDRLLAESRGE